MVISYFLSLRGNEGFLLEIEGIWDNTDRNTESYFWVSLSGKLKGEEVDQQHNIPCSRFTSCGIKVERIMWRLIKQKERMGIIRRPAILDW